VIALLLPLVMAETVDRILHVVDQRVVTASDVAFEAEIDPLDRSAVPALEDPAYPYEARLVDFAILRQQAGDVKVFAPSTAEVQARWLAFRDAWPTPEAYGAFRARWGLTDDDLLGFFYSRLVVERFVQRNLVGDRASAYPEWMAERRARAVIRSARP
jgi:hypothetical protein